MPRVPLVPCLMPCLPRQESWDRFMDDQPAEHLDIATITWVQDKQISLDAMHVAMVHLSNHNIAVRCAALRYALTLVEGCNGMAQNKMLEELTQFVRQSEGFFLMVMNTMDEILITMVDEERLRKRRFDSSRSSRGSMSGTGGRATLGGLDAEQERFDQQWKECHLLLRFLTQCVQVHPSLGVEGAAAGFAIVVCITLCECALV